MSIIIIEIIFLFLLNRSLKFVTVTFCSSVLYVQLCKMATLKAFITSLMVFLFFFFLSDGSAEFTPAQEQQLVCAHP